jgi:hypothetical protein
MDQDNNTQVNLEKNTQTIQENNEPINQNYAVQPTQENNIQPEKKKGKLGIIIAVIVVLCALGIGCFFLLNNKEDKKEPAKTEEKTEEKKEEKKEEPKKEKDTSSNYKAIYKDGKKELKIYCKDKRNCYIDFYEEDGSLYFTQSSISENVIKDRAFTLKFENDTAIVEEIVEEDYEENGISGTYKKEKDYTDEEFFKDKYGDAELLKSKYNGYYTLNKLKMYIYQKEEKTVRVFITGDFGIFDIEFEIQKDGTLYTDFFEDEYKITLTDDSAIFETTKTDKEEKPKDGVYKKEKTLSYKDILENIEP